MMVTLLLVLVFVIGVAVMVRKPRRESFAESSSRIASQMQAAGVDPYVIRKLAGGLASFDPFGWSHTPKAPVTVVNPVADGWKKALTMHISTAAYVLLDEIVSFPHGVFLFSEANFGGEIYVLPIEVASAPVTEFNGDSHRELIETSLKWLSPARIISATVPEGRLLVFELENGTDTVAKAGAHSAISLTAPIRRILIKNLT